MNAIIAVFAIAVLIFALAVITLSTLMYVIDIIQEIHYVRGKHGQRDS